MLMNDNENYGLISKLLHWAIALAIFGLLGLGIYMEGLEKANPDRQGIYALHKAIGSLVLFFAAFRIVWNRVSPAPALPDAFQGFERILPKVIVGLLYLLMLATPFMGIMMTQLYGMPVNIFDFFQLPTLVAKNKELAETVRELHGIFAWTMLTLIILHILGAAKHRIKNRGGETDILGRML